MTERSQIQQQADLYHSQDSGDGPPLSNVNNTRLDPHNSIEEYNRSMLEHTQRQMSTFVDLDSINLGDATSSRSSQSSGDSGTSSTGVLARGANGVPPTSASSSADARSSQQLRSKSSRSANERSF